MELRHLYLAVKGASGKAEVKVFQFKRTVERPLALQLACTQLRDTDMLIADSFIRRDAEDAANEYNASK